MKAIDWNKEFPIACINRADLTEFGFTDEQIATIFTDEVMAEIAAQMQEKYFLTLSYWFWDDLKHALGAFAQVPHEKRS